MPRLPTLNIQVLLKQKPDYKIMTFKEYGNYDLRIKLTKNAFEIKDYPMARLVSLQSSPQYIKELDLIVVDITVNA